MSTTTAPRPWDLRHLQQFLPAYPVAETAENSHVVAEPVSSSKPRDHDDSDLANDNLGDFSKIYKHLGISAPSTVGSGVVAIPAKDDYASDGAIHQVSTPPRHEASFLDFSDGMDGVEAVFTFDQTDPNQTPRSSAENSHHKKDRKKANREQKHSVPTPQRTALSESEHDSSFGRFTPARKASSHGMTTRSMYAKIQTNHTASSEQAIRAVAEAAVRLRSGDKDDIPDTPCPTKPLAPAVKSGFKPVSAPTDPSPDQISTDFDMATPQRQPLLPNIVNTHNLIPSSILPRQDSGPPYIVKTHPWPPVPTSTQPEQNSGPPYIVKSHPWPPSSASPQPKKDSGPPYIVKTLNSFPIPASTQPSQNNGSANRSTAQHMTPERYAKHFAPPSTIEPIILRSGEEREMSLFLKIIKDFYPDRKHMVKPANLITHDSDPAGIHVFVDASNIFIGFIEQLKRSRNIHPQQRVPDVNLSFDSLALLIERRRPIAKRVLVGSTPHLPAFDKARAVGYEVSILEKVMKAKELTERQIYFKEVEALRSGRKSSKKPPPHKITLQGSVLTPGGSETTTSPQPQFGPARLVEQGVDEILHLKMMESILDTETPGIMVLATGDAAQAEYSSGFVAMVERALRKGWSVELISWAHNVNALYKHKAWTVAWGERFRIIELDAYAEELLDM